MRKIITLTLTLLVLTLIGCSSNPKASAVANDRFDEMIDRLAEENVGRIVDIQAVDYLCFVAEIDETVEESCNYVVKFESSNFAGKRYADVFLSASQDEVGFYQISLIYDPEEYDSIISELHSDALLDYYKEALENEPTIEWYTIDAGTIRARRINQTVERLK